MPSLVEIGPVVLEIKRKCKKFTRTTTTTTTDNGQIVIRKAHLNPWLRWAKNKKPMGHFAHLSKNKPEQIYDFASRFVWSCYCLPLKIGSTCPLNKPEYSLLFAKFDWNWFIGFGQKDFKCRQCIFAISLLFHLGKGRFPWFEQTWVLFIEWCL